VPRIAGRVRICKKIVFLDESRGGKIGLRSASRKGKGPRWHQCIHGGN